MLQGCDLRHQLLRPGGRIPHGAGGRLGRVADTSRVVYCRICHPRWWQLGWNNLLQVVVGTRASCPQSVLDKWAPLAVNDAAPLRS